MPTTTQTVQAKARIRALKGVQAKANIFGFVTASCEVDFNVLPTVTAQCVVTFAVGDKVVAYRAVQAKASIVQAATAALTVTYTVDYPMPSGILRPTERTTLS